MPIENESDCRAAMSALEVERINNAAEQLNSESADVLEYQPSESCAKAKPQRL